MPHLEVEEQKDEMKASPDMPLILQNDEASKSLEDELNSQTTDDKQEGAGVVEESCVLTATSTDSEISRAVVDKSSYEATSSKIVTSRAISNHSEVGSSEGLDEPTTVDAAGADVETKKVGLPRTELPTSTPSPTDAGSVMSQGTSHGLECCPMPTRKRMLMRTSTPRAGMMRLR